MAPPVGRVCLTAALTLALIAHQIYASDWQRNEDNCFCQLEREIVLCPCNASSIDAFNNQRVLPVLDSLLRHQHFRFYKIRLNRPCQFTSDSEGVICGLHSCMLDISKNTSQSWHHDSHRDSTNDSNNETGKSLSQYFDLVNNPERFTGYSGAPAANIWQLIYEQKHVRSSRDSIVEMHPDGRHKESEPLLRRMMSGLHTSITVGMTAHKPIPPRHTYDQPTWGPSVDDFRRRFDLGDSGKLQRLKNMYLLYVIEMRAIVKAGPHLLCQSLDERYRSGLNQTLADLRAVLSSFPSQVDEKNLFMDEAYKIEDVISSQFRNISRIVDCVGCERCRLWARLQVAGMETTFKVLLHSDESNVTRLTVAPPSFRLSCRETIALLNSFGRLSSSIRELEMFRSLV